jgi:hypothetical protein
MAQVGLAGRGCDRHRQGCPAGVTRARCTYPSCPPCEIVTARCSAPTVGTCARGGQILEPAQIDMHQGAIGDGKGKAEIKAATGAVGAGKADGVALCGQLILDRGKHPGRVAASPGKGPDFLRPRSPAQLDHRHGAAVKGPRCDAEAGHPVGFAIRVRSAPDRPIQIQRGMGRQRDSQGTQALAVRASTGSMGVARPVCVMGLSGSRGTVMVCSHSREPQGSVKPQRRLVFAGDKDGKSSLSPPRPAPNRRRRAS